MRGGRILKVRITEITRALDRQGGDKFLIRLEGRVGLVRRGGGLQGAKYNILSKLLIKEKTFF